MPVGPLSQFFISSLVAMGYIVENDMDKAFKDADFVIMSVMPGTFDEMESEKEWIS